MTFRARAPLRLGLAGGGTDVSPYCDQYGGAVLNITVDRYAYAFIEQAVDDKIHFVAQDVNLEEAYNPENFSPTHCKLPLHAGVAKLMLTKYGQGMPSNIRVTTYVDAPPGSGLGSSSSLVVALVEVFAAYLSAPLGPYDVAHTAYEIERLHLQLAGGKQDQYAAAFGGVNFVEFLGNDRVIVNPLRVKDAVLQELETSMVVCFSGVSRSSDAIINEQQRRMANETPATIDSLHRLKQDAIDMKQALLHGTIGTVADILNRSWQAKKLLAPGISTSTIDTLYDVACNAGARGGKVSGAGGGGFMMFIVPPSRRVAVIGALNNAGAQAGSVHFVHDGSRAWTYQHD
jgi:D-glycero-alpha-D-manno-heptose-7-phosphate kinase